MNTFRMVEPKHVVKDKYHDKQKLKRAGKKIWIEPKQPIYARK